MIHQAPQSLTTRANRIAHRMLENTVTALDVTYSDSPYNDARVERRLTLTLENGTLQATRGNGQAVANHDLEAVLEVAYQNLATVTPRRIEA
jgi:hypothetical protein